MEGTFAWFAKIKLNLLEAEPIGHFEAGAIFCFKLKGALLQAAVLLKERPDRIDGKAPGIKVQKEEMKIFSEQFCQTEEEIRKVALNLPSLALGTSPKGRWIK